MLISPIFYVMLSMLFFVAVLAKAMAISTGVCDRTEPGWDGGCQCSFCGVYFLHCSIHLDGSWREVYPMASVLSRLYKGKVFCSCQYFQWPFCMQMQAHFGFLYRNLYGCRIILWRFYGRYIPDLQQASSARKNASVNYGIMLIGFNLSPGLLGLHLYQSDLSHDQWLSSGVCPGDGICGSRTGAYICI